MEVIPAIDIRNGACVQLVGGDVTKEKVHIDDLLQANAARVVVGTRAVTDDKWFAHVCERYGNRIFAAVDARGDDILIKGWTETSGKKLLPWARDADKLGVGGFLYTDVALEGRMGGVNAKAVVALAKKVDVPVIASGGVRDMNDLQDLWESHAWGVVVGMAAYTGSLDLAGAMKHFARKGGR